MKITKRTIKAIILLIIDAIAVFASSMLALLLVDDGKILFHSRLYYGLLAVNFIILASIYYGFHLYHCSFAHVGFMELTRTLMTCAIITVIQGFMAYAFKGYIGYISPAYFFLFYMFLVVISYSARCIRRSQLSVKSQISKFQSDKKTPVMIVGAGESGTVLIREIHNSDKVDAFVSCLVDDDVSKIGTYVYGIKVEGTRDDIPELAKKHKVKEIYIAIPSAGGETIHQISELCKSTGCTVKVLPGVYQIISGEAYLGMLKEVSIEDLLCRKPVETDVEKAIAYVNDKVVMVTGGGGSIGSELCRQIAKSGPHTLIIVDIYENNAYDIQQEIKKKHPDLNLEVLIASVRDEQRMEHIFAAYRPQIVFHAAAHKHVPLMEDSPNEAIKNNTFGTFKTAKLADKYGVKTFVLISTDKAVNPTNVMGASKRMCEMVIQSFAKISKTKFVAVRFGNVLGSNGSVVPLFKKQIASGGPVLVTHPDIIRYFMTIPEAVALVIQAGAYAKGGEIFVLDMGKPVKILDMAERMIKLSGYTPYKDIDIKFTGLRPGEKLYEEMLMDEEGLQETENKLIHIGKPIEMDEEKFFERLNDLKKILDTEPDNARQLISEMVPTYTGNADIKNI